MREIRFRGKRVDDFGWIVGFYVATKRADHLAHFIVNDNGRFRVHEDTIFQFTGIKDFNGNDIFEGDNVKIEVAKDVVHEGVIVYKESCFCFK